jgi:WD40 repeat protein
MTKKSVLWLTGLCLLMLAVFACASGGGGGTSGSSGGTAAKAGGMPQIEADIEVFPQLGNTGMIDFLAFAFSPDGTQFVANNKLWDMVTGREIRTISGSGRTFSPDGTQVVSVLRNTIIITDVASGKEIRTFSGHTGEVTAVVYSPDGTQIISGSGNGDGTIRVWDVASGREIRTLPVDKGVIRSIAFSPDGTRILSYSIGGNFSSPPTISLLDFSTGQVIRKLTNVQNPFISRDGNRLIYHDTGITVEDINSGQKIRTISLPRNYRLPDTSWSPLRLSPDGERILVTALPLTPNGILRLIQYDTNTGREIRTIEENNTPSVHGMIEIIFSPDGKQILVGGGTTMEGIINQYDAESGQLMRTFMSVRGRNTGRAFSPDGKQLITEFGIEKNITGGTRPG